MVRTGVTGCGLDMLGSEEGPVAGYCEYGNEPLSYVRYLGIS